MTKKSVKYFPDFDYLADEKRRVFRSPDLPGNAMSIQGHHMCLLPDSGVFESVTPHDRTEARFTTYHFVARWSESHTNVRYKCDSLATRDYASVLSHLCRSGLKLTQQTRLHPVLLVLLNRSGAHVERPAKDARYSRIAPVPRQRLLYGGHRVEAVLRGVARGGRPRAQVAGELRERPPHLQLDVGERHLIERKRNRPVPVEQQLSLGKPVGLERPAVELVQRSLECVAVENGIAVAPHCNRAAGGQHSPRFSEERGVVEPMERLRGGDEIDRSGRKAARFCAR